MSIRAFALFAVFLASGAADLRAQTYLAAPFANRSGQGGLDWIGENIGEAVRAALDREGISTLSREERAKVAARLSLKASSQLTLASVLKIAEAAGADFVVWGDYEVTAEGGAKPDAASQLRITVRVYSRNPATERLSATETGVLEDLALLQRAVAWNVFRAAVPLSRLTQAEFEARHPARKVNALENYVRGLLATNVEQRHHYFTQAVRIEPSFDEALFALGLMRWRSEEYS